MFTQTIRQSEFCIRVSSVSFGMDIAHKIVPLDFDFSPPGFSISMEMLHVG